MLLYLAMGTTTKLGYRLRYLLFASALGACANGQGEPGPGAVDAGPLGDGMSVGGTDAQTDAAQLSLAAPSALAQSPVSASEVELTWVDNSAGEEGVRVERAVAGSDVFETVGTTAGNATSYSDTTAMSVVSYDYRVVAFAGEEDSPASELVTTVASASALSVGSVGSLRVSLSWTDNSADEEGFRILRSDAGANSFVEVATVNADELSFVDEGLLPLTEYEYQVVAFNAANGDAFPTAVAATTTLAAPAALVINEVDYDDGGADTLEFIEIYNAGNTARSLDGVNLVLFDGSSAPATSYLTVDLSDGGAIPSLAAGAYLVVAGNAAQLNIGAAEVIDLATDDFIQNGAPDGIALFDSVEGTLIDSLSYGGEITDATLAGMSVNLVEGTATGLLDEDTDFSFALNANNPQGFVDISGTGTDLGLGDDGEANVTTTVTNALWTGNVTRVGNNGGILNTANADNLFAGNTALPAGNISSVALLPFWDDIDSDTGDVFHEERMVGGVNTLIVQWHDRPHFSNVGNSRFQVQVFATGPVLARFAYSDVDFGSATYDGGASATIGVQTPQSVATFSFNTASVMADDTIDVMVGPSLGRSPNAADTDDALSDFAKASPTPGAANL